MIPLLSGQCARKGALKQCHSRQITFFTGPSSHVNRHVSDFYRLCAHIWKDIKWLVEITTGDVSCPNWLAGKDSIRPYPVGKEVLCFYFSTRTLREALFSIDRHQNQIKTKYWLSLKRRTIKYWWHLKGLVREAALLGFFGKLLRS